jgi:hypothetical protein
MLDTTDSSAGVYGTGPRRTDENKDDNEVIRVITAGGEG